MRRISSILIAMMLSVLMISVTFAQDWEPDAAKMLVEPAVVTANPGDTFWVAVNIEKITDLYGFEFKLGYVAGTRVIGALSAEEGGFLWGPEGTAFTFTVDKIEGYIHVGGSILGDWPGMTGSGTLANIQFVVGEGGESPLELYEIGLLDSNLDEMTCQTRDGYFDGSNVELVRANIGARSKTVGEMQTFEAKIINEGTVPMYVGARFDNVRAEDGLTTSIWAGQNYVFPPVRDPETLHVDGYDVTRQQWTEYGAAPFLDAAGDSNYLEGSFDGAQHRWFSFEDIALEGAVIDYVQLWGYCDGPFNTDVDYDVYDADFNWIGSLYGTGAGPTWVTPRWTGGLMTSEILPYLLTEEGINDFIVLLYFYDPLGAGGAGNIVDALKLEITFKAERVILPLFPPVYVINPGEVLELPMAVWGLEPEDVGTYTCTVTVVYSFGETFWNAGSKKVITRSWWVK